MPRRYVSPTKALVNQVEADLYARFDKTFQKRSHARSLHGVFTKEYRLNVHDCQVRIADVWGVCVCVCFVASG